MEKPVSQILAWHVLRERGKVWDRRKTDGKGEQRETEEHDTPARSRHHKASAFAQLMSLFLSGTLTQWGSIQRGKKGKSCH